MKKLVFALFVFALTLQATSCKKKECPAPEKLTQKEILAKTVWDYYKLEAYDANGNLQNSMNLNYEVVFAVNGIYTIYDNNGNLHSQGTWQLNKDYDNEYIIIDNTSYSIDKLTEKDFIFYKEDPNGKRVAYMRPKN